MSKYNTLYYLLILLLITGAFASMAQNSYGIKIMGGVAAAFGLLFLIQALQSFYKDKNNPIEIVELCSLGLLSLIICLRVFYIHFLYAELIYGLAGVSLIWVYLYKMSTSFSQILKQNSYLAGMVILFYGSISLFILSMTITPFIPWLAEPAGVFAFTLIIIFTAVSLIKKEVLYNGEKVHALRLATQAEHRTVVVLSLFVLFSLYIGLNKVNVIPAIYSDEFPKAYFDLVNSAETGGDIPVDGLYEHDRFQEEYQKFIEKHADTFEH